MTLPVPGRDGDAASAPDIPEPPGLAQQGRLARLGFTDTDAAGAALRALGMPLGEDSADDPGGIALVEALAASANPDLAVRALRRVADASASPADLLSALRFHTGLRSRLVGILGASRALGDDLVRRPDDWLLLVDDAQATSRPSAYGLLRTLLDAVGAAPDQPLPWGTGGARARDAEPGTVDALRIAYRRQLLVLAARDLTGRASVDDVTAELSDLAAAVIEAALALALAALPAGASAVRLAVVAMGKCGGHELNYVSDVDVVFVVAPLGPGGEDMTALRTGTQLAENLIRFCGQPGPSGVIFPLDVGLRPEGRHGPLVRTLPSHRAYYERWARTWEFQALLKARAIAGDLSLGHQYCEQIAPLVWSASERSSFVGDVQAMRRRVETLVPKREADRQVKLGAGGLRDVEFAVQLLQLVHGRHDPRLRSPNTLTALEALREYGYVGRDDADQLADSYRWLRRVEHGLQLQNLRRLHTIPAGDGDRRWLARTIGYPTLADFDAAHRSHRREVRRLHEKLFYRPLLESVARLPSEGSRLSSDQARHRLRALGFAHPETALSHLTALTRGVSRRADIQRALLPVMLEWFAKSADPDAGLLAFRKVADSLGETPWFLRLLRDEGAVAQRLALVLSSSRYASDLLSIAPNAMRLLAADTSLLPRSRADLEVEVGGILERAPAAEVAISAVRGVRRAELFRIASADLLGLLDVGAVGCALSDAAAVSVQGALRLALDMVAAQRGTPPDFRIAVIALGRLGGREMSYGSDADVVFVHAADPGSDESAVARSARMVALETRRLLAHPAPDPPLALDAGLRPEGRRGELTRSLAGYQRYYSRWSSVWEAQALLRAAPLAGDQDLTARFLATAADPARYPELFDEGQLFEVRRLKRRMESERVNPLERARDLKLGPGGLADVEWTVQLTQLRHAHAVRALRVTGTMAALQAAVDEGFIDPADAGVLRSAWVLASRIRNAIMLVTGKPADLLPAAGSAELAGVARLLGYRADSPEDLVGAHADLASTARAVVERLLFGVHG